MAMTFDATLKDLARESPQGFLAAFDRPPTLPVKLLNVDLSRSSHDGRIRYVFDDLGTGGGAGNA